MSFPARFSRAAAFAFATMALGVSTSDALAADKVTFAWPGSMSSGYAPFTFAQELGYFKDENLELDTVLLQGAGTVIPQIMSGAIFTGFITLNPLVVARQPGGPNFEMRYVYNVVRSSVWEFVVLDTSPIKTLKDLSGKPIGVGALSFGNVPFTKALLKSQGVDAAEVQLAPVGLGVPAFDALVRGRVDALNLYDVMNVMLEQRGVKIRRLAQPKEYADVSSYGFPVSNKMIRENPQLVARFGRAFTKGVVACKVNLRGCLASYWKQRPDLKPVELTEAAIASELEVLNVRLKNMISSETQELGGFTPGDWTTTIAALAAGEQVQGADIKPDTLYTNQFVKDYNAFNRADVIAKAKAYPGITAQK